MRATITRSFRTARPPALLIAALLLSSCSGGGSSASPTTTTTSTTVGSTIRITGSADADVLAGYRAYWSAYRQGADPMDPQNPVLAEHATGPALEALQRSFLALKSAGKVIRGELDLAPRVVSINEGAAVVRDCYGDGTGVFDAATGTREDKPSGQRHLVTASMRVDHGAWKVEGLTNEGLGCTAA